MQALHIKHCGLTQCQIDPSIYSKYELDEDGKAKDFIFVITWTDDVRYFGTPNFVKQYEANVQRNMKCKMEGKSTQFVSISMLHKVKEGTLELTQPEYWEKAATRFKEYLSESGPKVRATPMSIADYTFMVDATEEEVKAAAHLPFLSLIHI